MLILSQFLGENRAVFYQGFKKGSPVRLLPKCNALQNTVPIDRMRCLNATFFTLYLERTV